MNYVKQRDKQLLIIARVVVICAAGNAPMGSMSNSFMSKYIKNTKDIDNKTKASVSCVLDKHVELIEMGLYSTGKCYISSFMLNNIIINALCDKSDDATLLRYCNDFSKACYEKHKQYSLKESMIADCYLFIDSVLNPKPIEQPPPPKNIKTKRRAAKK